MAAASSAKTAIITGVTGQDGAYLAQYLLERGYRVVGAVRRTSSVNHWRLAELGLLDRASLELVDFDLGDATSAIRLVAEHQPDEIYNLAAQSFVSVSFKQPLATADMTGLGALRLLEAVRIVKPDTRFYQASTSEMFGKAQTPRQSETTPFYPRSPYAFAKLMAHWATVNYRESYGIFAVSGILFNHESPLRGKEFVTRKIADHVARVSLGETAPLELGALDAQRDWGYAREYVAGMHAMLRHERPDTFVLATGRTSSVRRFVELAYGVIGLPLVWEGEGARELARDAHTGAVRVRVNPRFYRPAEVDLLLGDSGKAERELGWHAQTGLETLCEIMVKADIERNRQGRSF
ncbi:GDPmannose 4,6-dehydratase [Pseudochelatococcus lubricantis]|uniref:GDP-mannose 4,6-dehydratase n=1 Tax=Pseudochelatococcus lubricantis TaxID=1538102 RepID=A0ABX0V3P4_9HYPH|nr:GDP-mannose 4,6-dehydratase [Pseudochelatococcus lubricantis]NIJ57681.1 GDPmannose 4,6-dehydratase [Pseudochelatococcus lubricantis]